MDDQYQEPDPDDAENDASSGEDAGETEYDDTDNGEENQTPPESDWENDLAGRNTDSASQQAIREQARQAEAEAEAAQRAADEASDDGEGAEDNGDTEDKVSASAAETAPADSLAHDDENDFIDDNPADLPEEPETVKSGEAVPPDSGSPEKAPDNVRETAPAASDTPAENIEPAKDAAEPPRKISAAELESMFPLPPAPVQGECPKAPKQETQSVIKVASGQGFSVVVSQVMTPELKEAGVTRKQAAAAIFRRNFSAFSHTAPVFPYVDRELAIPGIPEMLNEDPAASDYLNAEGRKITRDTMPPTLSEKSCQEAEKVYNSAKTEWEKQVTEVKNARKRYLEEKGLTLETIAPK